MNRSILREMRGIIQMWFMLRMLGKLEELSCQHNIELTLENYKRDIRQEYFIFYYARTNSRTHFLGRTWCAIAHKKHIAKACFECEYDDYDFEAASPEVRKHATEAARLVRKALAFEPKPLIDKRTKLDKNGCEQVLIKLSSEGESFLELTNLISCLFQRYWATTTSLVVLSGSVIGIIYKILDVVAVSLRIS